MGNEQQFMWGWRCYRVDNDGVRECDKSRGCRAFISWGELETVGSGEIRSRHGHAINPRLAKQIQTDFLRAVNIAWRERYPAAQRTDNQRHLRKLRWGLCLLVPLLPTLGCVACYALYWWLGCPPAAAQEIAKVNRLAILTGVLIVACWLLDFLWLRRYAERPAVRKSTWK